MIFLLASVQVVHATLETELLSIGSPDHKVDVVNIEDGATEQDFETPTRDPIEKRVEALLAKMTLEEKVNQLVLPEVSPDDLMT